MFSNLNGPRPQEGDFESKIRGKSVPIFLQPVEITYKLIGNHGIVSTSNHLENPLEVFVVILVLNEGFSLFHCILNGLISLKFVLSISTVLV